MEDGSTAGASGGSSGCERGSAGAAATRRASEHYDILIFTDAKVRDECGVLVFFIILEDVPDAALYATLWSSTGVMLATDDGGISLAWAVGEHAN